MANTEQYPVQEARQVIQERLEQGWSLLEMRGVWVDEDGTVRAQQGPRFTSPEGTSDLAEISAILESWPHDEAFCLQLALVRARGD